jgi:hypothetical protein
VPTVPVPPLAPQLHPLDESAAPDTYRPGQPVWVYRNGSWRPGVVLDSTSRAVMVRYRPADGPGTGVDSVTGHSIVERTDVDAFLDDPALTAA